MTRAPAVLSVDAGTGDCRAIAFSLTGEVLASAGVEWTYERGASAEKDVFAFDPDACFQSVCGLIGRVVSALDGYQVRAVAVASQRDGMAFLDRFGRELYCAPNMDLRGKAVLAEMEPHRDEILQRTGLPLHPMFGLPRLLWHKRFLPQVYERIDCAMMLCDWLAYRLCGEKRSERAAAGSSQMLSLQSAAFDKELLGELGLRSDIFPEICGADEPVGALLNSVAAATGLTGGVPVFIGGSDAHCGIAGMGLFGTGVTAVIVGTTTPVMAILDAPHFDPAGNAFAGPAMWENQWTLECNAGGTGLSLRWLRDLLCQGADDAFGQMSREAEQVAPGCDGMAAYIGVTLAGEPQTANLGGFLFPVPWNITDFTRAHFFRAALETNAFGVCANLAALRALGADAPDVLHVCGGQSRSELFLQILADASNLPVQPYQNPESTALGAALCAAKGAGYFGSLDEAANAFVRPTERIEPRADGVKAYREIFGRWMGLRGHLLRFGPAAE